MKARSPRLSRRDRTLSHRLRASVFTLAFAFPALTVGLPAGATPPEPSWASADFLYFHRNKGGCLEGSIGNLRRLLSLHPNEADVLWRLGRSLEKLGERQKEKREKLATFAEAETLLKRAIALNPGLADAHFFLGITWGRIGQTRGILRSLFLVGPIKKEMRRTLEIDPKYSGAHHVLGEMLWRTPGFAGGSKQGAVREMEEAIALDPNNTTVYTDLAEAFLDIGERGKAKAVLRKIFDVKRPTDPAEYDGDVEAARKMLARLGAK